MWFLNLSEPQPSLLALNSKHVCRMHLSKSKHTGPLSLTGPHKFSPEGSYQTTCRRKRCWCAGDSSFYLVCTKVDPSLLCRKWLFPSPFSHGWCCKAGGAFKSHCLWGQAPSWSCLSLAQCCWKHNLCFWKMELGDETFPTYSCQLVPHHTVSYSVKVQYHPSSHFFQ